MRTPGGSLGSPPERAGGRALRPRLLEEPRWGWGERTHRSCFVCIGFGVCDILVQTQPLGWEAARGPSHAGALKGRCRGKGCKMLTHRHPGEAQTGGGCAALRPGPGSRDGAYCVQGRHGWGSPPSWGGTLVLILQMRKLVEVTGDPLQVVSPAVPRGVGSASRGRGFGDRTKALALSAPEVVLNHGPYSLPLLGLGSPVGATVRRDHARPPYSPALGTYLSPPPSQQQGGRAWVGLSRPGPRPWRASPAAAGCNALAETFRGPGQKQ